VHTYMVIYVAEALRLLFVLIIALVCVHMLLHESSYVSCLMFATGYPDGCLNGEIKIHNIYLLCEVSHSLI